MWVGGDEALGLLDDGAHPLPRVGLRGRTELGEELALLLLHVVLHRLGDLRHLLVEVGLVGVELLDVGQEAFDLGVLFDGVAGLLGPVLELGPHQGIDELLLDGGVHRQLVHDLARQFLLGLGL